MKDVRTAMGNAILFFRRVEILANCCDVRMNACVIELRNIIEAVVTPTSLNLRGRLGLILLLLSGRFALLYKCDI